MAYFIDLQQRNQTPPWLFLSCIHSHSLCVLKSSALDYKLGIQVL